MKMPPLRLLAVTCVACLTSTTGLAAALANPVLGLTADQPGPAVVLYLPATGGPTTLGTPELLSGLKLAKGSLTVLLGAPDERAAAVPGKPDWVVVVEAVWGNPAAASGIQPPTLWSNEAEQVLPIATRAFAGSVSAPSALAVTPLPAARRIASAATVILQVPVYDVPPSRRNRWTRNLTLELLLSLEMLTERPTLASLVPTIDLGFALYDSEGVGGTGPRQMERIVNEMPGHVPVMRVCPEDIRDGVLAVFPGVIFPGGSGRGIADALQAEGRQEVWSFVEGGGGYLGICAGAFFATNAIDVYLGAIPLTHNQPWRKGGGMLDVELTTAGQRIFGDEFTTFRTRYNNGPVYLPEANPLDGAAPGAPTVLAWFRSAVNRNDDTPSSEMIDTPAILSTTLGRGNMITISPHPETHPELFPILQRALLWITQRHPQP